ncbi:hypothetical protein Vretifemale_12128 [Volvox reticuliferus]|uniref:Polycomb protein VEFS-Box domain-containing protein n=1 Tax=Volvox reticuliferus TaxID=1737510 RepID=A0A8J4CK57_9CHLO|nr:hypothetical protein Vretifemale_12128 [Volvox reticuliferus]
MHNTQAHATPLPLSTFHQGPTLPPLAASEGGAAPVAATAAVGPAAGAAVLPAAFTVGAHPPGRRYFHCRTLMPGVTEEMFGAYDSDDETDDEEWEATFDRHMAHSTRITPLRPSEHRFFKLWSAFARRRPIYADYITRSRCLEFVREHGVLIRSEPELRAALVVHLMLLHEMNLVDPRVIGRCLLLVDGRISSTAEEDERFLATRGLEGVGRSAPAAGGALATVAPTVGAGAAVGGSGGAVVTAAVRDDDGEEQPTARGGEGGSSGSGDDGNGDDGEIEEGGGDGNREEGNADVKERVSRGQSAAPRGRRRRRQADSTTEEPSQRSKRRRRNDEPADTAQEGGPGKDSCPPSIEDAGQVMRVSIFVLMMFYALSYFLPFWPAESHNVPIGPSSLREPQLWLPRLMQPPWKLGRWRRNATRLALPVPGRAMLPLQPAMPWRRYGRALRPPGRPSASTQRRHFRGRIVRQHSLHDRWDLAIRAKMHRSNNVSRISNRNSNNRKGQHPRGRQQRGPLLPYPGPSRRGRLVRWRRRQGRGCRTSGCCQPFRPVWVSRQHQDLQRL